MSHHDLLPTPYVPELVEMAAERAHHVQERLGRPFGLENLSSYVAFKSSTMTEQEFYSAVIREADCWSLLDINNIYVSSQNHAFDADSYLAGIDFRACCRCISPVTRARPTAPSSTRTTVTLPMRSGICTRARGRWADRFPTLLEWDARIPPLPEVLAELAKAKAARS